MTGADAGLGDPDLVVGSANMTATFKFHVLADPFPDVLWRVANQLMLANVTPWFMQLTTKTDGQLSIEVVLGPISRINALFIVRKISQQMLTAAVHL